MIWVPEGSGGQSPRASYWCFWISFQQLLLCLRCSLSAKTFVNTLQLVIQGTESNSFLTFCWSSGGCYCVHGLPDYEHKSEYIKLCSIQELTKVQLFQVLIGKHTMRLWAFQESEAPSTDPKMKGGPICVEKKPSQMSSYWFQIRAEQRNGVVLDCKGGNQGPS